jgi:hypothetical protein
MQWCPAPRKETKGKKQQQGGRGEKRVSREQQERVRGEQKESKRRARGEQERVRGEQKESKGWYPVLFPAPSAVCCSGPVRQPTQGLHKGYQ